MRRVVKHKECKECKHNKGEHPSPADFIRCQRPGEDFVRLVHKLPSNENPGIKNAEMVVFCPNEKGAEKND